MLLAKSVQVSSVYTRPLEVRDPRKPRQSPLPGSSMFPKRGSTSLSERRRASSGSPARSAISRPPCSRRPASRESICSSRPSGSTPRVTLRGSCSGFVGMDNEGLEGLERSFDEYLTGERVKNVVQRDARGQILYTRRENDGTSGQDLHLTLDARIQFAMEEALGLDGHQAQAQNGMGHGRSRSRAGRFWPGPTIPSSTPIRTRTRLLPSGATESHWTPSSPARP
jgi:cell division protein FtsI (penicillin-binding protein 3)